MVGQGVARNEYAAMVDLPGELPPQSTRTLCSRGDLRVLSVASLGCSPAMRLASARAKRPGLGMAVR